MRAFVSQVRSWGGAVRVEVSGWRTGGSVPCGRGRVRVRGELRRTAVVSRSLRLTGDITLRHGWRDRGTEGAMVIEAEKCQRPDTAVTHTHSHTYAGTHTRAHTHTNRSSPDTEVHKDPGQRSLESLRVKKAGYSGQR